MLVFNFSVTPLALLSLLCLLILARESAPTYSAHHCTNRTFFQPNAPCQSNLNALLSSLASNSSLHSHNGFYRTAVGQYTPDVVDGLFHCRGYVNATVCQDCVAAAAINITRLCLNDTESIIWYDVCMLRYSNRTFDNVVPSFNLHDEGSIIGSNHDQFNLAC